MAKCGDCLHFPKCSHYVTPEETFPEVGGCSAFTEEGDLVEVVRCKDCKHWQVCYSALVGEVMCCMGQGTGYIQKAAEDFCSYGERKDNGKT